MSEADDEYFMHHDEFEPHKPRRHTMPKNDEDTIKTPVFRGSFVACIKPRKNTNDDGSESESFQMFIPLPKKDPQTAVLIKGLMALIAKASAAKHGAPGGLKPGQLKHYPIKNGDNMENEQFHGCWCINAKSNFQPSVCDTKGNVLDTEQEVYSGAWYRAKLSAWAWVNKKGGKGVSINLLSAVKIKDDTRFGGGSNAKEDFAEDIKEDDGLGGDAGGEEDLLGELG